MRARDLAQETWSALDANRGRSALTVLGIVIGIAAVIAMTALIGGINRALVGELGLSQAQLVYINVWTDHEITYDDVDKMSRDLTDYDLVVASSYGSASVTTGQKKASGNLTGVKPQYFDALGTKFVDGRPFTDAEERAGAMLIILDTESVRVLFGSADAKVVGKTVRVGNDECTIVGVVEQTAGSVPMDGEESINGFMPFSTMATRINGSRSVGQIMGFAHEGSNMDEVVRRTQDYLALTYNIGEEQRDDSIYVYSMKSMIDSVNATMASFSLLMTAVAGVSLLVGGIGIMNMMLTNVTERIREIGLRKALGARRADITRQFMLESICLCVTGGLIGIVLGYVGSFALTGLVADAFMGEGSTMAVTPVIDVGTVLLATGICVVTGVVFGWYPARRAAKLDPVESLHYQ
ncbi:MAG: ABC transporter permease [Coriobacteriales bacterium]|nr:ABC transporter permease [Coriobacteriales bacterium]